MTNINREAVEKLAETVNHTVRDMVGDQTVNSEEAKTLLALRAALDAAEGRVTESLLDPNAVHLNMLRGTIAMPSVAQIKHIYGDALTPATSDKIAEAARGLEQAEVLCQIEIDRGDRNSQHQYAAGARACRDALRALAGKGE